MVRHPQSRTNRRWRSIGRRSAGRDGLGSDTGWDILLGEVRAGVDAVGPDIRVGGGADDVDPEIDSAMGITRGTDVDVIELPGWISLTIGRSKNAVAGRH